MFEETIAEEVWGVNGNFQVWAVAAGDTECWS